MKILLTLSLLILTCYCYGQSKAELINAIKKMNILESENRGFLLIDPEDSTSKKKPTIPSKVNNYENFKALVSLIDSTELLKLGTDKNPIIRMFAIRELFQQKNTAFDFKKAFIAEVQRKLQIEDHEGCIISKEYTYNILFDDFSSNWNRTNFEQELNDFTFVDSILKGIDLYCLYSDSYLPDNIFETIFERRKYGNEHLERIKELVYTKDNFYAFKFLMDNYPDEFEEVKSKYLKNNFSDKRFDIVKHPYSFYELLTYSIQTSNKQLQINLTKQYDKIADKRNLKWIMYRIQTENPTTK